MRKLIFPFLLLLSACAGKKQNNPSSNSNSPAVLLTMDGAGPIQIGMPVQELEKILGHPVLLTNPTDTVSGSWQDSASITYQGAEFKVDFQRTYFNEDSFYMRVIRLYSSSPLCQTEKGIGIGSGKEDIVNAFETERIYLQHPFEDDTSSIRSKTKYTITVRKDREGPELIFRLLNNKVYALEAGTFYDDEE